MKLGITKQAFEGYAGNAHRKQGDYLLFRRRLHQASGSELTFVEWQGEPAVYFDQAYWRFERDRSANLLTLTACLGIFAYVGVKYMK